jgi:hypothetical protein
MRQIAAQRKMSIRSRSSKEETRTPRLKSKVVVFGRDCRETRGQIIQVVCSLRSMRGAGDLVGIYDKAMAPLDLSR